MSPGNWMARLSGSRPHTGISLPRPPSDGPEFVADFLHRGKKDVIQYTHGVLAHSGRVECVLDSFLLSVKHHPVDLLLRRHAGRRILLLGTRILLFGRREAFDETLQRVR